MKKRIQSFIKFRPNSKQLSNRLLYEFTKPKENLPYRPIWLLLYVTDSCNLKCAMCPHHTTLTINNFEYLKEPTYNMPLSILDKIITRFPEIMVASLAGVGEPTMHPNFPEYIKKLSSANMIIDLTTNGYFLKGEILASLINNKHVREISISLNGATEEEHFNITNKSGFKQVINNIKELVKQRKKTKNPSRISISQICTNSNSHLWDDYISLAKDLNVDRLYLHNMIDMNIQSKELKTLTTTSKLETLINNIPDKINHMEIIKPKLIKKMEDSPKCEWFFKNIAFDANGNLGSCGRVMNPQSNYGSIFSDEDPWNNSYMKELRSTFLDSTGKNLKNVCKVCIENF